jgi:hypothetical protein
MTDHRPGCRQAPARAGRCRAFRAGVHLAGDDQRLAQLPDGDAGVFVVGALQRTMSLGSGKTHALLALAGPSPAPSTGSVSTWTGAPDGAEVHRPDGRLGRARAARQEPPVRYGPGGERRRHGMLWPRRAAQGSSVNCPWNAGEAS